LNVGIRSVKTSLQALDVMISLVEFTREIRNSGLILVILFILHLASGFKGLNGVVGSG
jgi:hypothetical protein